MLTLCTSQSEVRSSCRACYQEQAFGETAQNCNVSRMHNLISDMIAQPRRPRGLLATSPFPWRFFLSLQLCKVMLCDAMLSPCCLPAFVDVFGAGLSSRGRLSDCWIPPDPTWQAVPRVVQPSGYIHLCLDELMCFSARFLTHTSRPSSQKDSSTSLPMASMVWSMMQVSLSYTHIHSHTHVVSFSLFHFLHFLSLSLSAPSHVVRRPSSSRKQTEGTGPAAQKEMNRRGHDRFAVRPNRL